jgi:sugar phosphate isomerase/epimerase
MQKRIIAINSNTYHGFTLDQALEGIKAAGFHSIELTATKGWTEHVFPNMSFEELWRIKDKLQDYEIDPISMSGHCNLMDQERIADFIANMRLANFFGCTYITSSVGEAHIKDKAHASNQEVAEHLKKCCRTLKNMTWFWGLRTMANIPPARLLKKLWMQLVRSG